MYFDHIYPSLLQDPPPPGEHLNDHTRALHSLMQSEHSNW